MKIVKKEILKTELLKLNAEALTKYLNKKFADVTLVLVTPLEWNESKDYKYESKWKFELFRGNGNGFMDVWADLTGIKDICIYGFNYFLDTTKITKEIENIVDGYIAKLVIKMEGIKNERK